MSEWWDAHMEEEQTEAEAWEARVEAPDERTPEEDLALLEEPTNAPA